MGTARRPAEDRAAPRRQSRARPGSRPTRRSTTSRRSRTSTWRPSRRRSACSAARPPTGSCGSTAGSSRLSGCLRTRCSVATGCARCTRSTGAESTRPAAPSTPALGTWCSHSASCARTAPCATCVPASCRARRVLTSQRCIVGAIEDVTDQVETVHARTAPTGADPFRSLVVASALGVIYSDVAGRVTYVNDRVARDLRHPAPKTSSAPTTCASHTRTTATRSSSR